MSPSQRGLGLMLSLWCPLCMSERELWFFHVWLSISRSWEGVENNHLSPICSRIFVILTWWDATKRESGGRHAIWKIRSDSQIRGLKDVRGPRLLRALSPQAIFPEQYDGTHIKICKNHLSNGGPHTVWAGSVGSCPSSSPGNLVFYTKKAHLCILTGHRGGNALRETRGEIYLRVWLAFLNGIKLQG